MKHTYYTATFNYLGQQLTISARVFDKWEMLSDRVKRQEAASTMTRMLREIGLYSNNCIHSRDIQQVKKSEAVTWADTLEQIEKAKQTFKEAPESIDKIVILQAHAAGIM